MTTQAETKPSHRLKSSLVTETFKPEVNGVAMTLGKITEQLANKQHQVQVIRPKQSDTDTPWHAYRDRETSRKSTRLNSSHRL